MKQINKKQLANKGGAFITASCGAPFVLSQLGGNR